MHCQNCDKPVLHTFLVLVAFHLHYADIIASCRHVDSVFAQLLESDPVRLLVVLHGLVELAHHVVYIACVV